MRLALTVLLLAAPLPAMAQGAPIVSTAELGTRSILLPASGALVVAEKAGPFASAVVRVLTEPGLADTLSRQGRPYARTWSSAAMAGRLCELYRSVAGPANTVARCAQRM